MTTTRSRRSGVEDRWYKRVKDPQTGEMIKARSAGYGRVTRWRARYVDDRGKEITKHFDRKIDATNWIDEQTASLVTGTYVAPKAGRITFKQYAEEWRLAQVSRPSTVDSVERALRLRVYPVIGERTLESLQPMHIQQLVRSLTLKYAPATVTVTYSYVATILKEAVRNRRIARTPCDEIKLPDIIKKRVEPLTTEQVFAIKEAMPDHLQAMVILAAGTGMRIGEALGLTEDRVRFLERRIIVDRQLVNVNGSAPEFGPPKTETSDRIIPLPDTVAVALSEHIKHHDRGPDGLLFVGRRGRPFRRSTFSEVWIRAMKEAGRQLAAAAAEEDRETDARTDCTGVGFHDLRHYYASLLIRHGESVKTVQARLGHKNAEETLNTYAHLWPDSDDRTREAVDTVLSAPAASPAESLRNGAVD